MTTSEMFSEFISNLVITNRETISNRYGEITSALNKQFRDTESKTENTRQVGSFGRGTGINGISDLDMLYMMPKAKLDDYKDGKQLKLLQDTKQAILNRYPTTKVKIDRLVVTVTYTNFHIEVQPVFKQDDDSYLYPDTKNGGSWKTTKPREEMNAIADMDSVKNGNLRQLCKMVRAWRNKHGFPMGGLLIDTLAYNFLNSTEEYDNKSHASYDRMSHDFFTHLSELPEQGEYSAPGSRQRVKVKKKFQKKAKKAAELCLEAIEAGGKASVHDKWKKVYGRPFPSSKVETTSSSTESLSVQWDDTEEFIEDRFDVDIRENLEIECEVKQNGFRKFFLSEILKRKIPLKSNKSLEFKVSSISVDPPYEIFWKVLNTGIEAQKRNCIRGQIVPDKGNLRKTENTNFQGDHVVERYCVKNGVVVAKRRIHVPIVPDGSDYE